MELASRGGEGGEHGEALTLSVPRELSPSPSSQRIPALRPQRGLVKFGTAGDL